MSEALIKILFPYLVSDTDRHGNVRRYVRMPGRKKVRIRGTPGSPEFMEAYYSAVAEKPPQSIPPHMTPGTFDWLCRDFCKSETFKQLTPRSQRVRMNILEAFCAKYGQFRFRTIRRHNILSFRDAKKEKPGSATNLIKSLRHVLNYAVDCQYIESNPAMAVPYLRKGGTGFHSWTEEEVRQYEDFWPVGSKPRLAMALLLFTGQRRSDAVRLGRQHERDGVLYYRQQKTGQEMATPILRELREIIDASPCGDLTYLVTHHGRPYTANGFGNAFRVWCNKARLPKCSAHGLRKAGAATAAERGATEAQLMAIYGWETFNQASVYIRAANRERLAKEAQHLIVRERSMNRNSPTITVPPKKRKRKSDA